MYLDTNAKLPYYSRNDEEAKKASQKRSVDNVRFIEGLEQKCWLSIRTVLRDADIEIQDIVAFIGNLSFHACKFRSRIRNH